MDVLDAQKVVINELSYDKQLFRKELLKTMGWLKSHEVFNLHRWARNKYSDKHPEVISDVFRNLNLF